MEDSYWLVGFYRASHQHTHTATEGLRDRWKHYLEHSGACSRVEGNFMKNKKLFITKDVGTPKIFCETRTFF